MKQFEIAHHMFYDWWSSIFLANALYTPQIILSPLPTVSHDKVCNFVLTLQVCYIKVWSRFIPHRPEIFLAIGCESVETVTHPWFRKIIDNKRNLIFLHVYNYCYIKVIPFPENSSHCLVKKNYLSKWQSHKEIKCLWSGRENFQFRLPLRTLNGIAQIKRIA